MAHSLINYEIKPLVVLVCVVLCCYTTCLFCFLFCVVTQHVNTIFASYIQICHHICLLMLDLSRFKVNLCQVLYQKYRANSKVICQLN